MAGNDGAGSIYGLAMRVSRLNADGTPRVGADNAYVSSALTKLDFKPNYLAGTAVDKRNAAGQVCLSHRQKDTLARVDLTITLCTPDPELTEILAGGVVLTSGGDTVGYGFPKVGSEPVEEGVSIEVWSRAIKANGLATTLPYIRWAFTRSYLTLGDSSIEADPMERPLDGFCEENEAWGNGPFNDFPYNSDRLVQWIREDTYPTPGVGYVAVPAQI